MIAPNNDSVPRFGPKPRLLYIVTEDWFFVTHFLPIARAARDNGFEVIVATQLGHHAADIAAEKFRIIGISADRRSFGAMSLVTKLLKLRKMIAAVQPAVIHAISLRSIVLGGLAAYLAGRRTAIFSLTGLGYGWSQDRLRLRLARALIRGTIGFLGTSSKAVFTFENDDDRKEFPSLARSIVIGGWGVAVNEFTPTRNSSKRPITVIYFGRMLKAKGVALAAEAVHLARSAVNVELELWGLPDPGNMTSHTAGELEELSRIDGVKWCGRAASAAAVWRRAHMAILLSEREGLPRSLIEAAACGVPMIGSDVPGCRSIIREGLDGFLVPREDGSAAAGAIIKLARDAELRERMGHAARQGFEQRYTTDKVVPKVLQLYFAVVSDTQMP